MFEQIHNTKEQIYSYERAENNKAKERLFEAFKWANFPGKHPNAGTDQYNLTIFTRPANTCTFPLKVYAIKNIR